MRAEVFAVEDTAVQVCWRGAGDGDVRVAAGHREVTSRGDVGAVIVDGLTPGTRVHVAAESGGRHRRVGAVTTLIPPPGAELSRFATINDAHIGARQFGTWRPLWDDDPTDPHPVRCLRAALREAKAWGAAAIIVKGDLTQRGLEVEWEAAAGLLAETGLPIVMIEGNHETKWGAVDGRRIMRAHGLDVAVGATALDLPGVRLVTMPTAAWHEDDGVLPPALVSDVADLASHAPAGAGVVVVQHHYMQRYRFPTLYPSGVPSTEGQPTVARLRAANPRLLLLAGHSHRHRRHLDHGTVLAETGSTKDFPGSWAGYTVHEGGVMQTTRRIMDPEVINWTERGRRVLGGVWGVWAPGLRTHRCFSYTWPSAG